MDLQPVVGAACAHCHNKIMVDIDGKNCQRCGLAVHRKCSKAHRAECSGKPAVQSVTHDYDESAPLVWNARIVTLLAIGAFILGIGLSMLSTSGPEAVPGEEPPPPSRTHTILEWAAVLGGLAVMAGS